MAVNVPLTNGPDGQFPLPFQGEAFILTRDKAELSFSDAGRKVGAVKGRLFVTNLRMVFLIREQDQQKAQAQTFEMPFRGVWDEKFHQPIFACNNLTFTVMYYDDQPFRGNLKARIIFIEGGVNTFLPVFNNVLRATRVQLQQENNATASLPIAVVPTAPPARDFMPDHNEAFVDPQDPSRIFTTQPAVDIADRRQEAPAWSVSGQGLRHR